MSLHAELSNWPTVANLFICVFYECRSVETGKLETDGDRRNAALRKGAEEGSNTCDTEGAGWWTTVGGRVRVSLGHGGTETTGRNKEDGTNTH